MICGGKENMYVLDTILDDFYTFINVPSEGNHIIRVHTKKLNSLGDLSLPLSIQNLYNLTSKDSYNREQNNYSVKSSLGVEKCDNSTVELIKRKLKEVSYGWIVQLNRAVVNTTSLHIYWERNEIFKIVTKQCFSMEQHYGALHRDFKIIADVNVIKLQEKNMNEVSLSNLRMLLLKEAIENLTAFQIHGEGIEKHVSITLTSKQKCNEHDVICGFVSSDSEDIFAENLFKKRSTDMRLMAEHKYGVRMKCSETRTEYFEKLGKAAVTLELLQNKPRKNMKIAFCNPSSANKDASFVLYNCARLSALFRDFTEKVSNETYPELVQLDSVDFSLLSQAEEWELFYVYVVQYPLLVKSCIKDMEKGIINSHYLVSFLCNLSSLFSIYYRRVRILAAPRPHLIPTLHARIYLLKSLQHIFHKTLQLLNIDPINNM